MVHTEAFEKDSVFVCDACGLSYRDAEVAAACEAYCRAHHACSLEIIRHAVKRG